MFSIRFSTELGISFNVLLDGLKDENERRGRNFLLLFDTFESVKRDGKFSGLIEGVLCMSFKFIKLEADALVWVRIFFKN